MGETSTFLLLGLVVLLILIAVGIFVLTLVYVQREQNKKRGASTQGAAAAGAAQVDALEREEAPQRAKERTAPVDRLARELEGEQPEAPAHPGEVMRVIRDQQTGRILVQVQGQKYTHIREIQDPQVGRRVLWAIADLLRFTGGMAANPQAVRSAARDEEPSAQPPEAPPARPSQPAATAPKADDALDSSLATPASETATSPQRYSMVDFFRRGFQAQPTSPTPLSTSFIDEIEAVLQRHIANLPEPPAETVHVTTSSTGKLQIEVGWKTYGSPEEVPDPTIRKLIQGAVAEWEKS